MKISRLLMAVALLCASMYGQIKVSPLLQPHQTFVDQGGAPCAGCALFSYTAGTTIAQPTYQDAGGTVPNTNPIVLSVQGGANIWVDTGKAYKFVLKNTSGTTLWTVDNVTSPGGGGGSGSISTNPSGSQIIIQPSGTSLYLNSFNNILYAQTGSSLSTMCSSFGGSPGQVVVSLPVTVAITTSLPANCAIDVEGGGKITVSSGTLTINGPFTAPSTAQVFAGTIAGLAAARPEWFGPSATICTAIGALGANGGDIYLNKGNYRSGCDNNTPSGPLDITFMTKPNVHVHGTNRGNYNATYTHIENGTIIQGGFYIRANGFSIDHASVDAGSEVMAAFYPGYTAEDSLLITGAIPNDPTHYPYLTGIRVNDVNCLGASNNTQDHCMLVENVDGAYVTNVQTAYHTHGFVLKGVGSHIDGVNARGSASECIVFKSDSYSPTAGDTLTNSVCSALKANGDGGGIQLYSAGSSMSGIFLSNIAVSDTTYGLQLNATQSMADIFIQGYSFDGKTLPSALCAQAIGVGGIGAVTIDNFHCTTSGGIDFSKGIAALTMSNLYLGSTTGDAISLGADAQISNVNVNVASGHGLTIIPSFVARVSNFTGTPTLSIFNGNVVYSDSFINQAPSLTNGWSASGGGNSAAQYKFDRGRVYLKGLYTPGTATTMFTLPTGYRPLETERLIGLGFNGTVYAACEVLVGSTGVVTVTNYATCSTGAGSYVSLDGLSFPVL